MCRCLNRVYEKLKKMGSWLKPTDPFRKKGMEVTARVVNLVPLVSPKVPKRGWSEDTSNALRIVLSLGAELMSLPWQVNCCGEHLCLMSIKSISHTYTWPWSCCITLVSISAPRVEDEVSCLRFGFENVWKSHYILKALGSWLLKIPHCRTYFHSIENSFVHQCWFFVSLTWLCYIFLWWRK